MKNVWMSVKNILPVSEDEVEVAVGARSVGGALVYDVLSKLSALVLSGVLTLGGGALVLVLVGGVTLVWMETLPLVSAA